MPDAGLHFLVRHRGAVHAQRLTADDGTHRSELDRHLLVLTWSDGDRSIHEAADPKGVRRGMEGHRDVRADEFIARRACGRHPVSVVAPVVAAVDLGSHLNGWHPACTHATALEKGLSIRTEHVHRHRAERGQHQFVNRVRVQRQGYRDGHLGGHRDLREHTEGRARERAVSRRDDLGELAPMKHGLALGVRERGDDRVWVTQEVLVAQADRHIGGGLARALEHAHTDVLCG